MRKVITLLSAVLLSTLVLAQVPKPTDAIKKSQEQKAPPKPTDAIKAAQKQKASRQEVPKPTDAVKAAQRQKAGTNNAPPPVVVSLPEEKNNQVKKNTKGGPPSWAPAWGRRRKDGTLNEYEGKKKEYKERRDDDDDDKKGERYERGKGKGKVKGNGNGKKDD